MPSLPEPGPYLPVVLLIPFSISTSSAMQHHVIFFNWWDGWNLHFLFIEKQLHSTTFINLYWLSADLQFNYLNFFGFFYIKKAHPLMFTSSIFSLVCIHSDLCEDGGNSSNLPAFSSSSLHYLKLRFFPPGHFKRLGMELQTSCYSGYNFYFLISPLLEFFCTDDLTNHLLNLLIFLQNIKSLDR